MYINQYTKIRLMQKLCNSVLGDSIDGKREAAFEMRLSEMSQTRQVRFHILHVFTETTNEYTNGISRHRLLPYSAYYQ